jgi:hypothetical protein
MLAIIKCFAMLPKEVFFETLKDIANGVLVPIVFYLYKYFIFKFRTCPILFFTTLSMI